MEPTLNSIVNFLSVGHIFKTVKLSCARDKTVKLSCAGIKLWNYPVPWIKLWNYPVPGIKLWNYPVPGIKLWNYPVPGIKLWNYLVSRMTKLCVPCFGFYRIILSCRTIVFKLKLLDWFHISDMSGHIYAWIFRPMPEPNYSA